MLDFILHILFVLFYRSKYVSGSFAYFSVLILLRFVIDLLRP